MKIPIAKNVASKPIAIDLIPIYPITELPAGAYPAKKFQYIYDDETLIQMKYDILKPPFLQYMVHSFYYGFIWI